MRNEIFRPTILCSLWPNGKKVSQLGLSKRCNNPNETQKLGDEVNCYNITYLA